MCVPLLRARFLYDMFCVRVCVFCFVCSFLLLLLLCDAVCVTIQFYCVCAMLRVCVFFVRLFGCSVLCVLVSVLFFLSASLFFNASVFVSCYRCRFC